MEAGRLTRRALIERRVVDPDGESILWQCVADRRASVRMMSGKEIVAADAPVSKVRASVRIRYRKALRQILRAGMRVTVDDLVMRIEAVQPDLARCEHIDLICVLDER